MFVNERTLMPIIVPLAPATSVTDRFPGYVSAVFAALGLDRSFIESEIAEMSDCRLARTNSRSLLGSLNEFVISAGRSVTTAPTTPWSSRSNWRKYLVLPCTEVTSLPTMNYAPSSPLWGMSGR